MHYTSYFCLFFLFLHPHNTGTRVSVMVLDLQLPLATTTTAVSGTLFHCLPACLLACSLPSSRNRTFPLSDRTSWCRTSTVLCGTYAIDRLQVPSIIPYHNIRPYCTSTSLPYRLDVYLLYLPTYPPTVLITPDLAPPRPLLPIHGRYNLTSRIGKYKKNAMIYNDNQILPVQ